MSLKEKTRIDWCDYTWNPVWGCLHTCSYCYARKTAARFGMDICGRTDFVPAWVEKNFAKPFPKAPSRIFVNSMSDPYFYELEWMDKIFKKIASAPEHTFLWLTKNPITYFNHPFGFFKNCWLGTSWDGGPQGDKYVKMGDNLHFLSIEPLLYEPHMDSVNWSNVGWVIIGPETGTRPDKIIPKKEWFETIISTCRAKNIPVFLKSASESIWGSDLPREYPK